MEYIDGKYASENSINIAGISRIRSKEDSTDGSAVTGIQDMTFYSFPVDNNTLFFLFNLRIFPHAYTRSLIPMPLP